MTRLSCFLSLLLLAPGCEQSSTPVSDPSASAAHSSKDDADETTSTPPKHAMVEVFINTHKYGDQNGCTTTFSPQPRSETSKTVHGSICGHPAAVSKLTWEYLGTDQAGDHYRFERMFPYDEPKQDTMTKEVAYAGQEMLLFEDDVQRIVMRPASGNSESQ
jgi:hypothetical protein